MLNILTLVYALITTPYDLAIAVVLATVFFYWLYVFVMGVYRAHLRRTLKWWHYVIFCLPVLLGLIVDVVFNLTIAVVVFKDMPREWLVTTRLKRYRATLAPSHRNHRLAAWICDQNLDIFDPTDDHC